MHIAMYVYVRICICIMCMHTIHTHAHAHTHTCTRIHACQIPGLKQFKRPRRSMSALKYFGNNTLASQLCSYSYDLILENQPSCYICYFEKCLCIEATMVLLIVLDCSHARLQYNQSNPSAIVFYSYLQQLQLTLLDFEHPFHNDCNIIYGVHM